MSTKVQTRKCRASFLTIIAPKAAAPNAEPKYSVMLLIPKTDDVTVKRLKDAAAEAHEADKAGSNKLKGVKNPPLPLHDGDGLTPKGKEYGPECHGHWVLSVNSKNRPGLVIREDGEKIPCKDPSPDVWYSGIYVAASLNAYVYSTAGNTGITFGLNHLMKLADGPALSGGGNPMEAFDDEFEDEDDLLG